MSIEELIRRFFDDINRAVNHYVGVSDDPPPPDGHDPDTMVSPEEEENIIITDEYGFRTNWGFATAIVQLVGGHAYKWVGDNKAGKPIFETIPDSRFPEGTIMQVHYPFIDGDGNFDAWRIWGWKRQDGSMSTSLQGKFINRKTTKVLEKHL